MVTGETSSSRPGSSPSATCPVVRRAAFPDKVAIVDGDVRLTFAELEPRGPCGGRAGGRRA